jgi:hypothetical protein
MDAGQFFVSIGIKGSEKAIANLTRIDKLLKGIKKNASIKINIGGKFPEAARENVRRQIKGYSEKAHEAARNLGKQKLIWAQRAKMNREVEKFSKNAKTSAERIRDLFRIKNSDQTQKAIKQTQIGLGNIASGALRAKFAILSATYALGYFFSKAGKRGIDLTNAGALLGGSNTALQRYQSVASKEGVSREEVTQTFLNIKNMLTHGALTGEYPLGLHRLQQHKPMSDVDLENAIANPQLILERIPDYLKLEKNEKFKNETLNSLLTPGMKALFLRGKFNAGALKNAPITDQETIDSLAGTHRDVEKFKEDLELKINELVAQFGPSLLSSIESMIPEISSLSKELIGLAQAFASLGQQIPFLKFFTTIVNGWTELVKAIKEGYQFSATGLFGTEEEKKEQQRKAAEDWDDRIRWRDYWDSEFGRRAKKYLQSPDLSSQFLTPGMDPNFYPSTKHMYRPPANPDNTQGRNQTFNINQRFDLKDSNKATEIAFEMKHQVRNAYLNLAGNTRIV